MGMEEDMISDRYDLGIDGERDVVDGVSEEDKYIDELMGYSVSFDGVEEGREDDEDE
jgi:hypothetical protein